MIYKLVTGTNPLDLNPGLALVPEFVNLTERQLFFVLLVCDPSQDNPIKTLPERQRRLKAAQLAGWPMETDGKRLDKNGREAASGGNANIERGIAKFKELHYDENADMLEALSQQLTEIREYLKSDKKEGGVIDPANLEKAVKLAKQVPELVKAKQQLEVLLGMDVKPTFDGYVTSEGAAQSNLSLIDQMIAKEL